MLADYVVTTFCNVDSVEWTAIVKGRPNVLMEGTPPLTASCLAAFQRHWTRPIHHVSCENEFGSRLPATFDGTVVLHGVEACGKREQLELLEWLDGMRHPTQVITTAHSVLFGLVRGQKFSERLYYRLNSVYLDLESLSYTWRM